MKRLSTAILSILAFATPMSAQESAEVHFDAGNFGTMVTGSITGDAYYDHVLGAMSGQEMFVDLQVAETDGNGVIYFNILPPGSDGAAIYNGSIDGNTAKIVLPDDGDYTIRTYLMGNDRDTDKTVSYNMDLSIQ